MRKIQKELKDKMKSVKKTREGKWRIKYRGARWKSCGMWWRKSHAATCPAPSSLNDVWQGQMSWITSSKGLIMVHQLIHLILDCSSPPLLLSIIPQQVWLGIYEKFRNMKNGQATNFIMIYSMMNRPQVEIFRLELLNTQSIVNYRPL